MSIQINLTRPNSNTFYPGLLPKQLNLEAVQHRVLRQLAASEVINLGIPKLPVGHLDKINPYDLTPAEYKTGFTGFYSTWLLKTSGVPKGSPLLLYNNLMMACFLDASGLSSEYNAAPLTRGRQKLFAAALNGLMGQWTVMARLTNLIKVRKDVGKRQFLVEVPLAIVNRLSLHAGMQLFTTYGDIVKASLKEGATPPPLPHIGPAPEDSEFKKVGKKKKKDEKPKDEDEEVNDDDNNNDIENEEDSEDDSNKDESAPTTDLIMEKDDAEFMLPLRFRIQDLVKHANPNLPIKVLSSMAAFTQEIFFIKKNAVVVMMARFVLDEKTSQAITCTAFNNVQTGESVNPADVFSFLRVWVDTLYGLRVKGALPRYIAPLNKIKASLPPGEDLRINDDDIAVDATGSFYMIPRQVDSITEYDNLMNAYLRNEDGTYSETGLDERPKPNAPANKAVFVDWVNKKFTYTNTAGAMSVLEMDRFQPAQPRHYARWFDLPFIKSSGPLSELINFLKSVAPSTPADLAIADLIAETQFYVKEETGKVVPIEKLRLSDTFTTRTPDGKLIPQAQALLTACKAVDSILKKDYSVAYTRYSVMTSVRAMALGHIIALHGQDLAALQAVDRESRAAYLNQSLDPNYEPEALPFVKDDPKAPMSVLPHQKKVLNAARTSPDFMLWGVAAGGGKTPLSVLNYLKELKEGHAHRVLVICPKSLVSTHVREITGFTNGRMNIIPVTDYTEKKLGLDRLQEMIDKAPINTVVITYFDMLARSVSVSYGSSAGHVYWVAEWLRQFNFDYCVIDEIHQLRNPSKKQTAVHRLISGIKKIRGMSGTLVANQLQDLAPQVALLDPTLFGSQQEFKKEYGEEFRGDKVTKWKSSAQAEIMSRIKSNVGFIQINRREWAALLPTMHEHFYPVRLTENQQKVYRLILGEADKDMKENEKIKRKLDEWQKRAKAEEEKTSDSPADSLEDSVSYAEIRRILKPYLARLERFVTAPYMEPLGHELLEGADKVSPKIVKVGEICTKHLQNNIPGKIIVFTNYEWSALDCFNYLDSLPALKGRVLHYEAGATAESAKAKFESNPKYAICVGIGDTLSTGLNLQFASRLIRIETVWTPGEHEQGNSRINRPNIQVAETRPEIFVDTIVAEDTIDVPKCAYLMSKIISAEKFYNHGDPRYDELEDPGLFSMTIENVMNMSNRLTLKEHFDAFKAYKDVQDQDYAEYRETHPKLTFTKVPRSGNLPGAALMRRTPYDPGTVLYGADKLGLVRYDLYMNLNEEDLIEDESSGEDESEDLTKRQIYAQESLKVRGLPVHCEFGEGEITKVTEYRVHLRLYSTGKIVNTSKLATFVITRTSTNSKDMRVLLAKQNPDFPMIDNGEEPEVPATDTPTTPTKKPVKPTTTKEEKVAAFELSFVTINGMLAISLENAENPTIARSAQQFGFQNPPPFIYAPCPHWRRLWAIILEWNFWGLKMPHQNAWELKSMYEHMRSAGNKGTSLFDFARKNSFQVFHRMTFKPDSRDDFIKPFPYIVNETYNIALPEAGQRGTLTARKVSVHITETGPAKRRDPKTGKKYEIVRPGSKPLKWRRVLADRNMFRFVGNKDEASSVIKEILAAGFQIANLKELQQEFRALRFKRDQKG